MVGWWYEQQLLCQTQPWLGCGRVGALTTSWAHPRTKQNITHLIEGLVWVFVPRSHYSFLIFLVAEQLYAWPCVSVCLSVCPPFFGDVARTRSYNIAAPFMLSPLDCWSTSYAGTWLRNATLRYLSLAERCHTQELFISLKNENNTKNEDKFEYFPDQFCAPTSKK